MIYLTNNPRRIFKMNVHQKLDKHLEDSAIRTAVLYLTSKAYHPSKYEKDFYDALLGEMPTPKCFPIPDED